MERPDTEYKQRRLILLQLTRIICFSVAATIDHSKLSRRIRGLNRNGPYPCYYLTLSLVLTYPCSSLSLSFLIIVLTSPCLSLSLSFLIIVLCSPCLSFFLFFLVRVLPYPCSSLSLSFLFLPDLCSSNPCSSLSLSFLIDDCHFPCSSLCLFFLIRVLLCPCSSLSWYCISLSLFFLVLVLPYPCSSLSLALVLAISFAQGPTAKGSTVPESAAQGPARQHKLR